MITTAIIVVTALAFILLLIVAHRSSPRVITPEEIQQLTTSVDLRAFRNLIDPEEDFFLKIHLSPHEFRRVKRHRRLATLEYVKAIAHNASVLARITQSATEHTAPEAALAARQLAESAVQLRVTAIAAMLRLYACMFFPRLSFGRSAVVEQYQQLTSRAADYLSLSAHAGTTAH